MPITLAGRRTIDVNDDVVRALQTWRRKQAKEQLLVGADYPDHDLVFARPDGNPTHPEVLSRTFEHLVGRAGLPTIRLHDYADPRVMPTPVGNPLQEGVNVPAMSA